MLICKKYFKFIDDSAGFNKSIFVGFNGEVDFLRYDRTIEGS